MFIRYYTGELSAPDLILLDISMLEESLSIIQIFQRYSFMRKVVLLVTSEGGDPVKNDWQSLKPVEHSYIPKPITQPAFERFIAKQFQ